MDKIDFLKCFNQPTPPSINESELFGTLPAILYDNTEDFSWVENVHINANYLNSLSKQFTDLDFERVEKSESLVLKIVEFIDLTTLSGDDTDEVVKKLTLTATQVLSKVEWHAVPGWQLGIKTAAVCVYPARVKAVFNTLRADDRAGTIKVAAVAGMCLLTCSEDLT